MRRHRGWTLCNSWLSSTYRQTRERLDLATSHSLHGHLNISRYFRGGGSPKPDLTGRESERTTPGTEGCAVSLTRLGIAMPATRYLICHNKDQTRE